MAMPRKRALPVAARQLRTRTALTLELIALRHQIAVLERNRTCRPCFRPSDRRLWLLLSQWWRGWREGLLIVQPETGLRWRRNGWSAIGDIDRVVAGEVGAPGSPVRSAI
jgi:hypothetical protein